MSTGWPMGGLYNIDIPGVWRLVGWRADRNRVLLEHDHAEVWRNVDQLGVALKPRASEAMTPAPLIIPTVDIAAAALRYWPEPTRYQATVMTTIALMESGGNARALYYNTTGDFPETLDRGLWGINEAAIANVFGYQPEPSSYADPNLNARMARTIWEYRYGQKADSPAFIALPYAYSGWTTYRKRLEGDPQYGEAWRILWPKAAAATGWNKA
jgi:Lysozyme like domain